eukprot:116017-Rhodomonas_salina.1
MRAAGSGSSWSLRLAAAQAARALTVGVQLRAAESDIGYGGGSDRPGRHGFQRHRAWRTRGRLPCLSTPLLSVHGN